MNQIAPTDPGLVTTGATTATGAMSSSAKLATATLPLQAGHVGTAARTATAGLEEEESLFEHHAWLYAFFRERIFRDDSDRMIAVLWPDGPPAPGTKMMEVGCGPGFYSCGFAARFPELSVLGVDQSVRQLDWAKTKARRLRLPNCRFDTDNVLDLSHDSETFDVAIAARLFTVLPDPRRALAEMHRVLRPGGRCLIAEPRYAFWASLPLFAMWVIAGLTRLNSAYREPSKATVLAPHAFRGLFTAGPWSRVKTWQDGRYQYALCEKD
jgi:SAM-dependent methyltransferase